MALVKCEATCALRYVRLEMRDGAGLRGVGGMKKWKKGTTLEHSELSRWQESGFKVSKSGSEISRRTL